MGWHGHNTGHCYAKLSTKWNAKGVGAHQVDVALGDLEQHDLQRLSLRRRRRLLAVAAARHGAGRRSAGGCSAANRSWAWRIVPSGEGETAGSGAAGPDPNAAWRSSESGRRSNQKRRRRGEGRRCGEGFWCGVGAGAWFGLAGGTQTRLPQQAVWLVKHGPGPLFWFSSLFSLFFFCLTQR